MPKTDSQRGFTIVELAIVLVVIGILLGVGASLVGPLAKRVKFNESREVVRAAHESIIGYVAANKRLPSNLSVLGVKTTDSYGKNLNYYFAAGLDINNICTTAGAYLTINDGSSGTVISHTNVAFIVFSSGEDYTNSTGAASPFVIQQSSSTYDDLALYADIDILRKQVCSSFSITTDSLPTGTEEISYPGASLQATDGTAPYSWSVTNGDLPSGLTVSSAGVISGVPTSAGTASFTVQAADSDAPNRITTRSLSITINPNPPRITTEFLTYGTESQTYPSTTLSVTGGKPPYAWSLFSGSLPPNLSLSGGGVISGAPSTAGTYSFTVEVKDSGSPVRVTYKTLSIAIYPSSSTSSTNSSSNSSTSTSSTTTSSSSSGSGGLPFSCTLGASPDIISSGQTSTLSWNVMNGPALVASFSPLSGTCTTFTNTNSGSCTTAAIAARRTFSLSITSDSGSSSCAATVYIGLAAYRVWNNTGGRSDFLVDGVCAAFNNNSEVTTATRRLNAGEVIQRFSSNNSKCTGTAVDQFTYSQAVYADLDSDGQVYYSGLDR